MRTMSFYWRKPETAMTRSRKKTPIAGFTTERSEKQFKKTENRRRRAAERSGQEFIRKSYGPKDGRQWLGKRYPKALRK
jgi:hypothetical protein